MQEVQSEVTGDDKGDPPFAILFVVTGAFKGVHGTVRGSQYMDLSDLWMFAPSQLFRAIKGGVPSVRGAKNVGSFRCTRHCASGIYVGVQCSTT
eukprot:4497891-Alexandrium_andersonii.AAC.1